VQSSSQIVTTNKPTPSFYRPDALPVTKSTVSKHCREKIKKKKTEIKLLTKNTGKTEQKTPTHL